MCYPSPRNLKLISSLHQHQASAEQVLLGFGNEIRIADHLSDNLEVLDCCSGWAKSWLRGELQVGFNIPEKSWGECEDLLANVIAGYLHGKYRFRFRNLRMTSASQGTRRRKQEAGTTCSPTSRLRPRAVVAFNVRNMFQRVEGFRLHHSMFHLHMILLANHVISNQSHANRADCWESTVELAVPAASLLNQMFIIRMRIPFLEVDATPKAHDFVIRFRRSRSAVWSCFARP